MEKQHTEPNSLNVEKSLYKKFFTVMVLTGGILGAWVLVLVFFYPHWLGYVINLDIIILLEMLISLGAWGWLLGMPAAWLTARSVRKRSLRRNGQGCLKTAVWGAWWSVWTTGMLFNFLFFKYLTESEDGVPMDWAQPDWRQVGMTLAFTTLIPAFCGLVSAAVLSLLLPKPETDCQTAFRQPENIQ